jgi:hypothetical protein
LPQFIEHIWLKFIQTYVFFSFHFMYYVIHIFEIARKQLQHLLENNQLLYS